MKKILYTKKNQLKLLIFILIFTFISISFVSAGTTYIDVCQTLDVEGETYILTDTADSGGNYPSFCFPITNNSVTLDCDNYMINSTLTTGTAIYLYGKAGNVTIKNCKITGWNLGIEVNAIQNVTMTNIHINNTYSDGWWIHDDSSPYTCDNITVQDSSCLNCSHGIDNYQGCDSNIFRNNNFTDNKKEGIGCYRNNYTKIINNTFYNNHEALDLTVVAQVQIINNTIKGSTLRGIDFNGGTGYIYNNYFDNPDNVTNVKDTGTHFYNITKTLGINIIGGLYFGGNYWGDYAGIDTNRDEIGDTSLPHDSSNNITTGGDYLPLVYPFPVIDLQLPINVDDNDQDMNFETEDIIGRVVRTVRDFGEKRDTSHIKPPPEDLVFNNRNNNKEIQHLDIKKINNKTFYNSIKEKNYLIITLGLISSLSILISFYLLKLFLYI